jgi:hypothetical protein
MWNKIHVETKLLLLFIASMFFISIGINGILRMFLYPDLNYYQDIEIFVLIFSALSLILGGLFLYYAQKIYKKEEEKRKCFEKKMGKMQRNAYSNKCTINFILGTIIFLLGLICYFLLFNPFNLKNYIMSSISYLSMICGAIISIWTLIINKNCQKWLIHSYEYFFIYIWVVTMLMISIGIPLGFIINPV